MKANLIAAEMVEALMVFEGNQQIKTATLLELHNFRCS